MSGLTATLVVALVLALVLALVRPSSKGDWAALCVTVVVAMSVFDRPYTMAVFAVLAVVYALLHIADEIKASR